MPFVVVMHSLSCMSTTMGVGRCSSHCPTGLRRRFRGIYSASCGKNGTFPEPLASVSVRRFNIKPRRYEESGWEVGKIERSSELVGLARVSILPLLTLLMYVYSSKVVGAVGEFGIRACLLKRHTHISCIELL